MPQIKFYLITHHGVPKYVGSTIKDLDTRLIQHFQVAEKKQKCKLYKAMMQDPHAWKINLLETKFMNDTTEGRRVIENRLKKKWKTTLNETEGLC